MLFWPAASYFIDKRKHYWGEKGNAPLPPVATGLQIPGHGCVLQSSTSVKSSQPFPGSLGNGSTHARSRDFFPPPHEALHTPHSPNSDAPPSFAETTKIRNIFKKHTFIRNTIYEKKERIHYRKLLCHHC